jgi:ribonuclease R
MLLANKRVAEFIGKVDKRKQKPKTFVYRIHDKPDPEKLANFSQFLGKLGYKLNTDNRRGLASSYNKLFKQIEGKGEQNMIETIAIRTMAKAVYSTENIGHYGLGFPFYTHFTSPIRRYPDLMVHRLLDHYLHGGSSVSQPEYEKKCEQSSEMERKAVEAERESIKYKQAEYLMDKIGQEFDGLISGVSKWGIYVEIIGNKCEGMVRLKDMQDDYYYLDEDNYQVIGHRHGQQYKLGDPVRIRIKKIDLSRKEMDFELVTDTRPRRKNQKGGRHRR